MSEKDTHVVKLKIYGCGGKLRSGENILLKGNKSP